MNGLMNFGNVGISRVRDYWNERPCNIRHSTAPVGTKEYFDQVRLANTSWNITLPGFAEFERWRGKKYRDRLRHRQRHDYFARAGAQVHDVTFPINRWSWPGRRAAVFGVEERIRFLSGNAEQLSRFRAAGAVRFDLTPSGYSPTPNPMRLEQLGSTAALGKTTVKIMVYTDGRKVAWIWRRRQGPILENCRPGAKKL